MGRVGGGDVGHIVDCSCILSIDGDGGDGGDRGG